MQPNPRTQQLSGELTTRRETLRRLRSELSAQEALFMRTRGSGQAITALRESIHLEELRVQGVEMDLDRIQRTNEIVPITAPPNQLREQRRQVEVRRAWRLKVRAEQEQAIRDRFPRKPAHADIAVRNELGPSEPSQKKQHDAEQAELDRIDRELTELERRQAVA